MGPGFSSTCLDEYPWPLGFVCRFDSAQQSATCQTWGLHGTRAWDSPCPPRSPDIGRAGPRERGTDRDRSVIQRQTDYTSPRGVRREGRRRGAVTPARPIGLEKPRRQRTAPSRASRSSRRYVCVLWSLGTWCVDFLACRTVERDSISIPVHLGCHCPQGRPSPRALHNPGARGMERVLVLWSGASVHLHANRERGREAGSPLPLSRPCIRPPSTLLPVYSCDREPST